MKEQKSKPNMKITAGLGSIDDYEDFVQAGASELFCGYVPENWMLDQGLRVPLNRREVLYYNVQVGSESELMILSDMVSAYRVPVTIALNGLSYEPKQWNQIEAIMERCQELGFSDFILADGNLLRHLKKRKDKKIHLSGEYGELNHRIVREMEQKGVRRMIFPRQTTLDEMEQIIARTASEKMEYEAFLLNERCQFTGAYCNSLHCDELCHMCRVPYRLSNWRATVSQCEKPKRIEKPEQTDGMEQTSEGHLEDFDGIGATGCGLCALWRMREIGITHLKIVSRGNATEQTIKDIRAVKKALNLLKDSASEEEYVTRMKQVIFPEGCSGNCYYRDR